MDGWQRGRSQRVANSQAVMARRFESCTVRQKAGDPVDDRSAQLVTACGPPMHSSSDLQMAQRADLHSVVEGSIPSLDTTSGPAEPAAGFLILLGLGSTP